MRLLRSVCLGVCGHHLGVGVLLRNREAELLHYLGVDDRCAVGDSTYSHGLGVGAVEDLNAHLSGLFAERDVVDADGSEAAVLDLLDLGAVNRDISGVCLLNNDREVVYNVVVGEVVDAVYLRSQSCSSLGDISRAETPWSTTSMPFSVHTALKDSS